MIATDKRKAIFLLHQESMQVREIVRKLGVSRNTVRDIIRQCGVLPARVRKDKKRLDQELLRQLYHQCQGRVVRVHEKLVEEEGIAVCYSTLTQMLRELGISNAKTITIAEQRRNWMRLVLQGVKTIPQIKQDIGDTLSIDDVETLVECVWTKALHLRNRSLALLAHGHGIPTGHIASFLCVERKTARRYISDFKKGGVQWVLDLSHEKVKKADDPNYAAAVFKALHTPPSAFGFNRTTWRMDDLHAVLQQQGVPISKNIIHKIIKAAGYRFRKARRVLTSTDPEYRDKLPKIIQMLS